jgi:LysM repeat protein
MINRPMYICTIFLLVLSGCALSPTPTPTPVQIAPTSTHHQQSTSAAPILSPTLETATIEVTEQTATLESTATLEPTVTVPVLVITVVSDEQQTAIPPPASCQRPQNWIAYTVQVSDTLSSVAQRTGTSWQQIQAANCLTGTVIFAGQTLYLPYAPAAVTNLPEPMPTILTIPPSVPGDPKLSVSPASGGPGTTFTIGMDDFPRDHDIRLVITFANTGLLAARETLVPNEEGDATYPYKSRDDAQAGKYNVYALSISSDPPVQKVGEFEIIIPPTQTP